MTLPKAEDIRMMTGKNADVEQARSKLANRLRAHAESLAHGKVIRFGYESEEQKFRSVLRVMGRDLYEAGYAAGMVLNDQGEDRYLQISLPEFAPHDGMVLPEGYKR